jgi:hypothetical protein
LNFIKFGKYSFLGPFDGVKYLSDKPGIFVILCKDIREEGKYYIIDVDEADNVKTFAMNHERQVDWVKNSHGIGKLAVAVQYTGLMNKEDRQKIIKNLRELYDIPCGPKSQKK